MVVGISVVVCVPAHAVTLRYAPRVGEVHKQRAVVTGTADTTAMGQTMNGTISMTMDYSEKALSQNNATTRVQTDLLGGKGSVSMAGQNQSIDLPTGKVVAEMDRRNRVVKLISAEVPGAQDAMGPGAESFPNWSQFGAFPEGDVSINDKWSGTVSIPASAGMPSINMAYECTLLDLTEEQGRKCAKIRTAFSGPFQMDLGGVKGMPQGASGEMNAAIEGSIIWLYDYENSVFVSGDGSVNMDMIMSMSGDPSMPAGDISTKIAMNVNTALQQ